MAESANLRAVDAEHPWLGLTPFSVATRRYFFGREKEIKELFRRASQNSLTVLFGQSGLGKSSILGAGLVPLLESKGYQARIVRLDHTATAKPLVEQVRDVVRTLLPGQADRPAPDAADAAPPTLWELLHHLPGRTWEPATLRPIIIFDQFEEIFTLTDSKLRDAEKQEAEAARQTKSPWSEDAQAKTPAAERGDLRALANRARAGVEEFLYQLSDLVENRPSAVVEERIAANPLLTDEYDFDPSPLRIVITLREDFLSRLEAWRKVMPSLMSNRMALQPLAGPQALEAVVRPGRLGASELVSDEVGAAIVRFVAKRAPDTPLEDVEAVPPPLLSLVCQELNEARLAARVPTITTEQVSIESADILQLFFDRSFEGLPPEVRHMVEERMVTVSGHRNSVARVDAIDELRTKGVPDAAASAALDRLVQGRLLSAEERGGIQRLEITHDVLTPLVVRSKRLRGERERADAERRRAEEAKAEAARQLLEIGKQRRRVLASAALAVVALIACGFALVALQSARKSSQKAEEARGVAWVSYQRAERLQMKAEAAQLDALNAKKIAYAEISPADYATGQTHLSQGRWREALAYFDRSLRYDPANEHVPPALWLALLYGTRDKGLASDNRAELDAAALGASLGPDGLTAVTFDADGNVQLWNLDPVPAEKIGDPLELGAPPDSARFNRDGSRVLILGRHADTAWQLDTKSGKHVGAPLRHTSKLTTAEFSPNGSQIVTSSYDGTAQIWNATNGARVGRPVQHDEPGLLHAATFSPDGHRFATAGRDCTVRIWEAGSSRALGPPLRHESEVTSVAFSADGTRLLAVAGADTAYVWEVATARLLATLRPQDSAVLGAIFCLDGSCVATRGERKVQLWSVATAQPMGPAVVVTTGNSDEEDSWDRDPSILFSPDGTRIAALFTKGKFARVWDLLKPGSQIVKLAHESDVTDASFSPDGSRLVTASKDHTARVWDSMDGRPVNSSMEHSNTVNTASFSADNSHVITAGEDKAVLLWNVALERSSGIPLPHRDQVVASCFSPDGSRIFTCSSDGRARVWITKDATLAYDLSRQNRFRQVAKAQFSRDGKRIMTVHEDSSIRIWRAEDGHLSATLDEIGSVDAFSLSFDGLSLLTASGRTVRLWDATTGQPRSEPLQVDAAISNVEFLPDGTRFIVATDPGDEREPARARSGPVADVRNATTLRTEFKLTGHTGRIGQINFSPDGSRIVTSSWDRTARVWSTTDGKLMGKALEHSYPVLDASFAPDGKRVLTICEDRSVRIWDLATSFEKVAPMEHKDAVTNASFSGEGLFVITACADGTAQVWNASTGLPVGPALHHQAAVTRASFSPDGRRILTSSADRTARLWDFDFKPTPRPASETEDDLLRFTAKYSADALLDPALGTLQSFSLTSKVDVNQLRDQLAKNLAPFPNWEFALRRLNDVLEPDEPVSHCCEDLTVRNVATRLIETRYPACIREAHLLDPGHPLIQIALAFLESKDAPARAAWLRRYGVERLPDDDAEMCRLAVELLIEQGDRDAARAALRLAEKAELDAGELTELRRKLAALK